jgi:phage/plasmid primase-like uncharacterized protein
MKLRDPQFEDRIAYARAVDIYAEATRRGARLTRVGQEWIGPCPLCGGRDRFSVSSRKRVFNCRGCQVGGDVIQLVQHLDQCDFKDAVEQLVGAGDGPVEHRAACAPISQLTGESESNAALAIWEESRDPRGTPGERYLERRSLELRAELAVDVLRFHEGLRLDGRRVPGLVALFRDIVTDAPRAIQRVFLQPDGEKITRRMLGPVRGAAIKLDGNADVTEGLHIGEGFETCMAARALGFKPTWALGSAGAIQAFPSAACN